MANYKRPAHLNAMIDPELHRELKIRAVASGKSMKILIEEALRLSFMKNDRASSGKDLPVDSRV